jgi:hypothetical protein
VWGRAGGVAALLLFAVWVLLRPPRAPQPSIAPLPAGVPENPGPPATARTLPEPPPADVVIEVRTNVEKADVSLDGRPVGRTPLTLRVPPGIHALEVSRPGYRKVTKTFTATRDDTMSFSLHHK